MTQAHADARRRQILRGAVRAFAREGLSSVTMQAIAREAGVAVGTLYLHFESKADVLHALGEASMSAGREMLEALRGREDPLEALQELLQRLMAMGETQGGVANSRVDTYLRSEALADDGLRKLVRDAHDEWRSSIAEALRDAVEKGRVRSEIDPEGVAIALVALLTGVSAELALDPGYSTAQVSAATASLLDGLRS